MNIHVNIHQIKSEIRIFNVKIFPFFKQIFILVSVPVCWMCDLLIIYNAQDASNALLATCCGFRPPFTTLLSINPYVKTSRN